MQISLQRHLRSPLVWLWGGVLGALLPWSAPASGADEVGPAIAKHLAEGKLAEAQHELQGIVPRPAQARQARFALGIVHVLQAIEGFAQAQYRHGALTDATRRIPIFRIPVPANEAPEPISYPQLREIIAQFQQKIAAALAELEQVNLQEDFQLRLDLAAIRLDLDGNGQATEAESLLPILAQVNRGNGREANDFPVSLDRGDVLWLQGYCHFLSAFCDVFLTYDHQRLFDYCGQVIYPRRVPSDPQLESLDQLDRETDQYILDLVATIHLIQLPVLEPDRARQARQHLLAMIRTSRESWQFILAETDNQEEWLPKPGQTGVLQIPVSQEMVDGWHRTLLEMEDLLEGRKLVPFWRDYARVLGPSREIPARGRGVNLRRWFDEPREFDLVLIVQGSGVLPYVEEGPFSSPETWSELERIFQGQFFGFAIWFN